MTRRVDNLLNFYKKGKVTNNELVTLLEKEKFRERKDDCIFSQHS